MTFITKLLLKINICDGYLSGGVFHKIFKICSLTTDLLWFQLTSSVQQGLTIHTHEDNAHIVTSILHVPRVDRNVTFTCLASNTPLGKREVIQRRAKVIVLPKRKLSIAVLYICFNISITAASAALECFRYFQESWPMMRIQFLTHWCPSHPRWMGDCACKLTPHWF